MRFIAASHRLHGHSVCISSLYLCLSYVCARCYTFVSIGVLPYLLRVGILSQRDEGGLLHCPLRRLLGSYSNAAHDRAKAVSTQRLAPS